MLSSTIRLVGGTAALATGGWLLRALHGAPSALGAGVEAIAKVADGSPNYRGGVFHNLEPASMISLSRQDQWRLLHDLFDDATKGPKQPIPVITPKTGVPAADLALTWYGHSSVVVEVDGYRILADPVWSQRCSPSRSVGPQRLHPVPAPLEALPAIDAVIISHDHYDHLDVDTVKRLVETQNSVFYVPLGIGAHLRGWGVPDQRIVELDWGQSGELGELRIVCTPARHFSGRFLTRNTTLWSSWAIIGPRHRAFFGGDTGYTASFAEVGDEYGPFDLTLMPVGAYHPGWPDIHMNPEEAVRAHRDVTDAGRGLFVPIHWATFRLAPHPWSEPIERMLTAATESAVAAAVPRPGQRVEVGTATSPPSIDDDAWWRL
ncbi:MBL fold metallo-hydrolase [[Mycobacterium] burgundiense]|uniref:MBL fold metallo-hydrolase n=1 Tax=[Mycobacterium] burgundiense TaxID=3064286 RepID=A0ABM9LCK9_9MYCO|nr:MBL fold metallo-hydrolase [Mycolicibacterium sp. MU0053]CAJ1496766.1 MBL fold metallo-hydrolase [Mycolicibacterium sp. MU0053]